MCDEPVWILRINAIWFPIGLRMVVRCGMADAPEDDALILREDGWHRIDAFVLGTRKAVKSVGEEYGWYRVYSQQSMTHIGWVVLRDGLDEIAYADAVAGNEIIWEHHATFDPRKPGRVFP